VLPAAIAVATDFLFRFRRPHPHPFPPYPFVLLPFNPAAVTPFYTSQKIMFQHAGRKEKYQQQRGK